MAITAAHPHLNSPRTSPITDQDDDENALITANIRAVSTPPWPVPARPRTWPAAALAAAAIVLAASALLVALTRPVPTPAGPTAPTYSAADTAAAKKALCDTYKLAAADVRVDTASGDKAIARVATTNGAVLLNAAAGAPALDPKIRDAALALAAAYATLTALGNATDQQYQAALDDLAAKDGTLKGLCNG
jgi:hypothetical protein